MKRRVLSLLVAFAMVITMIPATALTAFGATGALTISTQPQDVKCEHGVTAQFTVGVSGGTQPYEYQWQFASEGENRDWTDLDEAYWSLGVNTANLRIGVSNVMMDYGYKFRCVVTDAKGNTVVSNAAKPVRATASGELSVYIQPKDVTCDPGEWVDFMVAATDGTTPYKHQWQYTFDGYDGWIDITEEDDWADGYDTYYLQVYTYDGHFDYGYKYRCVITDSAGNTVTSDSAKLIRETDIGDIFIKYQPENVTCDAGDTARFEATASGGTTPHSYQWQYTYDGCDGWVDFTEEDTWASGTDYFVMYVDVTNEDFDYNYKYRCVVTDAEGDTAISEEVCAVRKSAAPALSIEKQPEDVTCEGDEWIDFSVDPTGGKSPYKYQWQYTLDGYDQWFDFNEENSGWADGWNSSYLSIYATKADDFEKHYRYRCVVTDQKGNKVISKEVKAVDKAAKLLGDADGNKKVLANDAMLVLQYSTKVINGNSLDLTVCDVDGNGKVLANDAMLILQYSTKVIDKFPAGGGNSGDSGNSETAKIYKNLTNLKDYIISYGGTNKQDNKFIKAESTADDGDHLQTAIIYQDETDDFNFAFMRESPEGIYYAAELTLNRDASGKVTPEIFLVYEEGGVYFDTHVSFAPGTYDGTETVSFTIDEVIGLESGDVQDLSNTILQQAFKTWEILLSAKTGLHLTDIGFTDYKAE